MTQNARPVVLHTIGSRWDNTSWNRRFPFEPEYLLELGASLRLVVRGQYVEELDIAEAQRFAEAGVPVQVEGDDLRLLAATMRRLSVRSELRDSALFYDQTA